jgi:tetratricopeptide (TPR) repeat protein
MSDQAVAKKPIKKGKKKKAPPQNRAVPWWIAAVVGVGLTAATVVLWSPRSVPEPSVQRGNEHYRSMRFQEALSEYESAPGAGPRNAGVHLDRGLAKFRVVLPSDAGLALLGPDASVPAGMEQVQELFRTAARGGTTSATEDVDAFLRARAMYDLANSFFSTRQWDNAIDSYKEALRLRPGWLEAAWNLALARRLKELDRTPPDAGNDASDNNQSDATPPPRDANDEGGNNDPRDASGDGGEGRGDGGQNGDASSSRDGSQGDNDASSPPPSDDAGPPSEQDASAPRTMAPLDQLERASRSLQQEMMRRRGFVPRSSDDDR